MVAKIGRSSNLFGTLSYNNVKMEQDKGEILMTNKIIETADGKYSVSQLSKSFEPYLIANRNTEKHTLHISLNPDPKDRVSDEKYREIAQQYMNEMGYGNQPFVVFKHTDIDRSHIHIVSICVDEDGKKISDKFEKIRSMNTCRELEKAFGLRTISNEQKHQNLKIFKPVSYAEGNVKSQIASVVRHLSSHYKFQSLGEYNALLSLYNITSELVEGELNGQLQRGLLYFPTDNQGKKVGSPFKSSLFGKSPGINALEKYFKNCERDMKNQSQKQAVTEVILAIAESSNIETGFREKLLTQGIETILRRNVEGRIYGITFIDHKSKTVWNGSRLGKDLSANIFNEKWNNNKMREVGNDSTANKNSIEPQANSDTHKTHNWSTVKENDWSDVIDAFGSLIPLTTPQVYDETDFINQKKKKKKNKPYQ